MAVKRKLITLSLYEEDLNTLDWVAAEVGLGRSETVRRLVEKAYLDDKTRAIIKRGFRPTLNNAHYETNDGNQNPGDQTGEDSSSLDPKNNIADIVNRIYDLRKKYNCWLVQWPIYDDDEDKKATIKQKLNEIAEEHNALVDRYHALSRHPLKAIEHIRTKQ